MEKKRSTRYSFIIILFFSLISVLGVLATNTGIVDLLIGNNFMIQIYNPEEIVYNFSIGDNYTLGLNTSANFDAVNWSYSLFDLTHDSIIYSNVPFENNGSNITFNAVRWSNRLVVKAFDSGGNSYNSSVNFYVSVPNSAPLIYGINDSILVCENSPLSYLFEVFDIDEDALEVGIIPKNPFYSGFYSSINLTTKKYILFSGYLRKEHVGLHEESVYASDIEYADTKFLNITVIGVNNAPVLTNIGVHTIWSRGENSTFYYKALVMDTEDGDQDSGNLTFNITFFSGDNLFGISDTGIMNFTANPSLVGVHNISVCVEDKGLTSPHLNISMCGQDGSSITSCDNFSLTITNENRAPVILNYSPSQENIEMVGEQETLFNILSYDADGTIPDVYFYVDNISKGDSSDASNVSFLYAFDCGIRGIHEIKIVITDGVANDSVSWSASVTPSICPTGGVDTGRGSSTTLFCEELWGCGEWTNCISLESESAKGFRDISFSESEVIKERCNLFEWDDSFCGFQLRECKDVNFCKTNRTKPGIIRECYYTENPSCSDGIKNCHDGKCEILVDCGGPCNPCLSCSDKIKNQGEEGIDCGGPCPPCIDFPSPRGIRWFVYMSVIIFLIILVLIVKLSIKVYKTKKRLEKEALRRKGA